MARQLPLTKKPALGGLFRCPESRSSRLLDLGFLVGHVLADLGIELAHFHLFRVQALVLGGGVEMAGARGGQQLDLVAHDEVSWRSGYSRSPLARRSDRTASMPFFSMVRRPLVDTRRLTKRRSPSTQNRCTCRLGRKRRRR